MVVGYVHQKAKDEDIMNKIFTTNTTLEPDSKKKKENEEPILRSAVIKMLKEKGIYSVQYILVRSEPINVRNNGNLRICCPR